MKHLTLNDRFMLKRLLDKGYKKKQIADILNCHINTITNELKRICKNTRNYKEYNPGLADEAYRNKLKEKGKEYKVLQDENLLNFLTQKISVEKYSPEACLLEIKRKNLSFSVTINSVNTLYNSIIKGLIPNVTLEKLHRKKNKTKRYIERKQKKPLPGTSIEKRDKQVNIRDTFGHWEMDCVIGMKSNKKTVLVLTERKTRYEVIEILKRKTAKEVVKALNRIEKRLGKHFYRIFKTIAVDNGTEFSNFRGMEKSLYRKGKRTRIYYCHPYCPSERGSNEVNNILIRYFLPKSSNFDDYRICNIHIIKNIQNWMNKYPRKLFDGGTSVDFYTQELSLMNIPYIC